LNKSAWLLSAGILALAVLVLRPPAQSRPPGEPLVGGAGYAMSSHLQEKAAPDFTLKLLDGSTFRLSDHLGKKVIILNFFATWCGPCKKEMPELTSFLEKHRDEPLIMIGIDGGESHRKVRSFVSEYGVTFPVGIDKGSIQESYGVRSFPTTVLIGADGTVGLFHMGPVRDAEGTFGPLLKKSLGLLGPGRS
jgi:peroxiredoxin